MVSSSDQLQQVVDAAPNLVFVGESSSVFQVTIPLPKTFGTSQSDVWKYCPIDNCTNEAEVTARKPWNQSEDARGSTDCFTPWCGPCKLIEPALGRLAMDDNLCKQCTFVKVLSRPIDRDQAS